MNRLDSNILDTIRKKNQANNCGGEIQFVNV